MTNAASHAVARYGRPDYFLTFTANPNWSEIKANLRPGETAANRPDLVARVFRARFKKILRVLTKDHVLGKAIAWTYVIEFQKRGLPHAHLLLIVAAADKPDTPAKIDRAVCAEIPDRLRDPTLYDLVANHMVHGPCGALNPSCPCMKDGLCTKYYPKPWREETVVNLNGFPAYRRRELHPLPTVAKGVLDGRSIVPYNAFLLELWDGHLNVEVCTSIKAVKYLYKYTYKGPDRACFEHVVDEVTDFLDARYVGAPEAAWRLFEFELHGRSHPIERLPVHLPLHQAVYFQNGHEQECVRQAMSRTTKLEAWFELNSAKDVDPLTQALSHSLRYFELPDYFTWDSVACKWWPRKRRARGGNVIGRMTYVKPSAGEQFYLRLLLLHVLGSQALSWFALKACAEEGGEPSFQAKARMMGLLHDDHETLQMLEEACRVIKSIHKLCELFCEALVWLDVHDKPSLWTVFLDYLCRHHKQVCATLVYDCVQDHLAKYHLSMQMFDICQPAVSDETAPALGVQDEYQLELRRPEEMRKEKTLHDSLMLNDDQLTVPVPLAKISGSCVHRP